jgi:hypothetical protein
MINAKLIKYSEIFQQFDLEGQIIIFHWRFTHCGRLIGGGV